MSEADGNLSQKKVFVEDFGVMFESMSLPRMAGRILGWLLVCVPPYQSADQIATALDASKGMVSTMTRFLIQLGFIEKLTFPGDRRDYFRMKQNLWEHLMNSRISELTRMRAIAERGLSLMEENEEVRRRLYEMRDIYVFFEREFPEMMSRYHTGR